MKDTLDIISTGEYPANVLSNFYPNAFVFDGVQCASAEGLLQSLKTKNTQLQVEVCGLSGKAAKGFFRRRFQNIRWKLTGNLYWKGKPIKRSSDEYQIFLDRVYDALLSNEEFRKALLASKGLVLTHRIGKTDTSKTILTEYEFVSRLMRCAQRVD